MKIPRHSYAIGATSWGPLPDTEDAHIMWDGPGSGLYFYPRYSDITAPHMRIRHETANGTYDTLKQAEKAVYAFIEAGLKS